MTGFDFPDLDRKLDAIKKAIEWASGCNAVWSDQSDGGIVRDGNVWAEISIGTISSLGEIDVEEYQTDDSDYPRNERYISQKIIAFQVRLRSRNQEHVRSAWYAATRLVQRIEHSYVNEQYLEPNCVSIAEIGDVVNLPINHDNRIEDVANVEFDFHTALRDSDAANAGTWIESVEFAFRDELKIAAKNLYAYGYGAIRFIDSLVIDALDVEYSGDADLLHGHRTVQQARTLSVSGNAEYHHGGATVQASRELELSGEARLRSYLYYISVATGDYNADSTWDRTGYPGDGDTVTINWGHTVTIQGTSEAAGEQASPATNAFLLRGNLEMAQGSELTLLGTMSGNTGYFAMADDCRLLIDPPAGETYLVDLSFWAAPDSRIRSLGTENNRNEVRNIGSGACGFKSTNGDLGNAGDVTFEYTDFYGIGDATQYFMRFRQRFEMRNCLLDGCGQIENWGNGPTPSYDFEISRNTLINNPGTYDMDLDMQEDIDSGAILRIMNDNSFTKRVLFHNMRHLAVTENYFGGTVGFAHALSHQPESFDNNFMYYEGDERMNIEHVGPTFLCMSDQIDNPHFFVCRDGNQTIDGCVFEYMGDYGGDVGDGFTASPLPSNTALLSARNCITLPNVNGRASCTISATGRGVGLVRWQYENCTVYASSGGTGGILIAVHLVGVADMINRVRDNLFWAKDTDTNANKMVDYRPHNDPADDYVTECDYNGGHNIAVDYNVKPEAFLTPPGVNDISGDPQFVDTERDLANWARTILGQTGTESQMQEYARNAMLYKNEPRSSYYHSGVDPSALLSWIKAGFVPQNTAYHTGGHSGGHLGAVDPT